MRAVSQVWKLLLLKKLLVSPKAHNNLRFENYFKTRKKHVWCVKGIQPVSDDCSFSVELPHQADQSVPVNMIASNAASSLVTLHFLCTWNRYPVISYSGRPKPRRLYASNGTHEIFLSQNFPEQR